MADKKISALTGASTPLAGTEVLPIVQSGSTVKVSVADLTAGRAISALSATFTNALAIANGGTNGTATPTAGAVSYGTGTAYAFTSAGTVGQVLTSGGTGAPAFNSVINVQNSYAKMTSTGTTYNSSGSYHELKQDLGNNYNTYLVNTNNTSGYGLFAYFANCAPNDTASKFMECADNTATRLTIYSNGNVVNTNGSYGTISDAKLKTDIVPANSQWEDVKALAKIMSKFKLISDAEGKTQLGWIAQDVQKIAPGLIFATPDKKLKEIAPAIPELKDENGNVIQEAVPAQTALVENGEVTLGIHHSVAQLKAFKALGEALERIEKLEAEIAALKS